MLALFGVFIWLNQDLFSNISHKHTKIGFLIYHMLLSLIIFVAQGKRRWVIQLCLHAPAVELSEWLFGREKLFWYFCFRWLKSASLLFRKKKRQHRPLYSDPGMQTLTHLTPALFNIPSDCCIFPRMKKSFSYCHFDSNSEVITAVDLSFEEPRHFSFKEGIHMLHDCWTKCVNARGHDVVT